MTKGKHVSSGRQSAFLRDSVIMVVGILIIAALTYGAIWLFQDLTGGSDDDPVAVATTTTTAAPTATAGPSTTAAPTTSTSPSTTTTTAPVIEVRPPEEITVLVLNSIGTPGLAGRVTEQLAGMGYVTLEPDNYEPELEQSRIWYKEGFGPDANELAAVFPDALRELNPDAALEADIVVLLGASYEDPE